VNVTSKSAALAKIQNGPRINWAEQSPELVRKFTEVALALRASLPSATCGDTPPVCLSGWRLHVLHLPLTPVDKDMRG
jgi:hypothetical protein